MNRHVLSVLVENQSGVLSRVAGLFSRRGYNIDNLSVGETEDPKISRMTIVVRCDDQILDQIKNRSKSWSMCLRWWNWTRNSRSYANWR